MFLIDTWGRRPLLIVSTIGTLICYPLMGTMTTAFSIAAAVFFAQMLSSGIMFPALFSWINENYPSEIRASGMGWSQVTGRFAGFLAPNIIGVAVAAGWGFQSIGFLLGMPSLISVFLVIGFLKETKRGYLDVG